MHIYSKVSRRENPSLDYALSLPLRLMVVGFNSGAIKLFMFDYSHKYLLELKGHAGPCLAVRVSQNTPSTLYSVGTDCSLRVWNLLHYQTLYVLRIDTMVVSATFLNEELLFGISSDGHGKSWLLQLNSNLLEPANIDKGEVVRLRCDASWCVAVFADNLVSFFPTINTDKGGLAEEKFEHPEKYGAVRDILRLGP